MTMTLALYDKIIRLSCNAIQLANLGKVINIIAVDFRLFEEKFYFLFSLTVAPFTLVFSAIILWQRVGA